jgi:hypothetical protein
MCYGRHEYMYKLATGFDSEQEQGFSSPPFSGWLLDPHNLLSDEYLRLFPGIKWP